MHSICLYEHGLLKAKPEEKKSRAEIQSAHTLNSSVTVIDIVSKRHNPLAPATSPVEPVQFYSKGPVAVDKEALEYALDRLAVDKGPLENPLHRSGGRTALIEAMK